MQPSFLPSLKIGINARYTDLSPADPFGFNAYFLRLYSRLYPISYGGDTFHRRETSKILNCLSCPTHVIHQIFTFKFSHYLHSSKLTQPNNPSSHPHTQSHPTHPNHSTQKPIPQIKSQQNKPSGLSSKFTSQNQPQASIYIQNLTPTNVYKNIMYPLHTYPYTHPILFTIFSPHIQIQKPDQKK